MKDKFYQLAFWTLLLAVLFFALLKVGYQWNWVALAPYWGRFVEGWFNTLLISIVALVLSFALGLLLALGQKSTFNLLKIASEQWVGLIRGTPLLVQLLIFYYVIANAFGFENRWFLAVLILSNFSAAYVSEILRAAINGIPMSQKDAARAMGLSRYQIFRWVIFPQMIKASLPALAGQFSSIIKDSSLLSVIAVSELTLNSQEINSVTYSTLEIYLPLALGYLSLTLPIAYVAKKLERSLRYEN
ncbi:MAG: amino acid ABC transporter permease [Proteobacteria bacterium]|nr:amino acid ABC transporter permease [Pseudomonadota bacterium]